MLEQSGQGKSLLLFWDFLWGSLGYSPKGMYVGIGKAWRMNSGLNSGWDIMGWRIAEVVSESDVSRGDGLVAGWIKMDRARPALYIVAHTGSF